MRFLTVFFIILLMTSSMLSADSWLSTDKFIHAGSMAFLSCWTYNFNQDALLLSQKSNVSFTISSSLLIGLFKEYSDQNQPGNHWSWKDIAANLTGIGIGFVLINNLP